MAAPERGAVALAKAQELCDAGEDALALEQVEKSLQLQPADSNPRAAVLKAWLQRFGKGSEADKAVQRVLACPQGDFYAVLAASRYVAPPRADYLRLSLLLHPDKCGARHASEAYARVTEAYNALKDPNQRAKHDEKLRRAEQRAKHMEAASSANGSCRPAGGNAGFGAAARHHPYQRRPHAPQRPRQPAPSSPYPVAALHDACAKLPVYELLLALERLGEVTNTRSQNRAARPHSHNRALEATAGASERER